MKKRLLSTLLALCMVLALLPGTALAAETQTAYPKMYFNGHAYQLIEAPLNWTEAKQACEELGGHLATITSAAEQSFIESLIKSGSKNHYWLGASNSTQAGSWQWVTGEAFSYQNWDYGEPNNYLRKEFYLQIFRVPNPAVKGSKANKWNDISLSCTTTSAEKNFFDLDKTGYICEWETIQFTVSFDPNGGSVTPESKTYTANTALGSLPTPTRTGSTFTGWYTAKTGGKKVTATTKVTADMTLYAHWTKVAATKTYTITLNANGGNVSPSSLKVESGKTYYNDLPTPTRAGYKFDGWYTTKTGTTKITAATKATANRTVYAHWTRSRTYLTVSFDPNGGTVYQDMKLVISGNSYKELPTPTRPNYIFKGWYTARTGGRKVTETTRSTLTGSQTLYAQWQASATAKTTTGKWTVSVPPYFELPLYSTAATAKISSFALEKGVYQDITCTRKAVLSTGVVRYYGMVNGKNVWFTYSCEMDLR